jgi:NADH:ubiquinone oxidoreductase subunit 3 (subunit A)
MAALITTLIGVLQIMQALLAQENQELKKSAFNSGQKAREFEYRES